ncbi:MAG: CotH kinase family protein [Anaerolineae bacterium]|nr:CotH kinase family protein [Anaerolineae bacterium]
MSLKLKRNYPLLVLLALVVVFLTLGVGNRRIVAYTVQGGSVVAQRGIDYTGGTLFDDTVVHSIRILISDEDYQKMVTTYQETGEKDYFHADVIIDGVRVNDVGLRLKGNASLRTALGGRGGGMAMEGREPGNAEGMGGRGQRDAEGSNWPRFDPQNMPDAGEMPQPPGRGEWPAFPDGGEMPDLEDMSGPVDGEMPDWEQGARTFGSMPFGQDSDIAQVPFMIKFDEFISGQTYQGYANLAVRTYGTTPDASMLQEPITNFVFRLVGLPATRTAYVGVQINDEAEQLYTISEVINEDYLAEYFANSDGVLYKAELGSSLAYQGEDPSAYSRSFTQQTRVNDADMAPLIEFVRFLDEADDTTFESELPDYLDVDSFATYLAINNLLVNTDSIVGMNNNYYLYYDDVTDRFTLLMWDGNESLGKLGGGNNAATHDLYAASQSGGRGMGGGQNTLVKRFMANATFKALYEEKLKLVYQEAFLRGRINQKVEEYAVMIREANPQRNLVVLDTYEAAVTGVLSFIEQRRSYLSNTPLLGG